MKCRNFWHCNASHRQTTNRTPGRPCYVSHRLTNQSGGYSTCYKAVMVVPCDTNQIMMLPQVCWISTTMSQWDTQLIALGIPFLYLKWESHSCVIEFKLVYTVDSHQLTAVLDQSVNCKIQADESWADQFEVVTNPPVFTLKVSPMSTYSRILASSLNAHLQPPHLKVLIWAFEPHP